MSRAIGIDLGTTFSAMASIDEQGRAYVIPNAEGTSSTPSVVLWDEGRFLVGQPALDRMLRAEGKEREHVNAALIRGVKRMIGRPPEGGLFSNGHRTNPVEVSAAILRKLVADASTYLGYSVQDAVITVPAHFVNYERDATRRAAEMAGLHVLQIINEPSAAALVYAHRQAHEPGTALVFDLGGGTFDATVLDLRAHETRVLSTKGVEELGGINFTINLSKLLRQLYKQQTKQPFPDDSEANSLLFSVAESSKCRLSGEQSVEVYLAPRTGKATKLLVTRSQFEAQNNLLLLQLDVAVDQAVKGAQKNPREIQRVLLCGGSSRIPAVQQMLTRIFGRQPESILDLDLSVALGAAYHAAASQQDLAQLQSGLQLSEDTERLIDCVSYAVGIVIKDRNMQDTKLVMLHPGDPLGSWSRPYSVRVLGSAKSFPPIQIYSGEGIELLENERLGQLIVPLPDDMQDGASAEIMMRQDRSGLLEIKINSRGKDFPGGLQRIEH